ncbi:MAG: hypothetical protein P8104_04385 [Gammaproteobacteria bacterium]
MPQALTGNRYYSDSSPSQSKQHSSSANTNEYSKNGFSLGRALKAGAIGVLALSGGAASRVAPPRVEYRGGTANNKPSLNKPSWKGGRHLLQDIGDFNQLNSWAKNNNVTANALRRATGQDDLSKASASTLDACTAEKATITADSSEGAFYACGDDFEASVGFLPKDTNGNSLSKEQGIVLAQLSDQQVSSYDTRKAFDGNQCKHVSSVVGKDCFAKIAGSVAESFVPRIRPSASQAEIVDEINQFKPRKTTFPGEKEMCYYNTGNFSLSGLQPMDALSAKEQRSSAYDACETSKGDDRLWAGTAWNHIRLLTTPAVSVALGLAAVGGWAFLGMGLGGLGSCCKS